MPCQSGSAGSNLLINACPANRSFPYRRLIPGLLLALAYTQFAWLWMSSNLVALADPATATSPRVDNLPKQSWWQNQVRSQAIAHQSTHLDRCLFGDSISSALGNSLGPGTVNFGIGGLSSISLVEQLQTLKAANISCTKAVIAIGTNDAWYSVSNAVFISKMEQAILLVRDMGATDIILVPAFYSTLEASYNPSLAGPLERVDEINALLRQVAEVEQVPIVDEGLQALFDSQGLRQDLTFDGVHLNDNGKQIYRQFLMRVFGS